MSLPKWSYHVDRFLFFAALADIVKLPLQHCQEVKVEKREYKYILPRRRRDAGVFLLLITIYDLETQRVAARPIQGFDVTGYLGCTGYASYEMCPYDRIISRQNKRQQSCLNQLRCVKTRTSAENLDSINMLLWIPVPLWLHGLVLFAQRPSASQLYKYFKVTNWFQRLCASAVICICILFFLLWPPGNVLVADQSWLC